MGHHGEVRRVSVVGNSGSGKSTVGAALATRLGVPFVELDAIMHHRPNWEDLPTDEFRAAVAEVVAGDEWVVDGNYTVALDVVWARADTVVWLDLPRRTVMRQVVGRTLVRVIRGTELWNGNRERLAGMLATRPEESIILWAWTHHHVYRQRYADAMADPEWSRLAFVRLTSRAAVQDWLAAQDPCTRRPS
jgi:adenylate kinase family enzyme